MISEEFVSMYETYFGQLTGKARSGLSDWAADKPAENVERLFDAIADEHAGKMYRPMYPELRKRYRAMKASGDGCSKCNKTGWSYVVMAGSTPSTFVPLDRDGRAMIHDGERKWLQPVPQDWTYRDHCVPCLCEMGTDANDRMKPRYNFQTLQRLHDKCVRPAEAIGNFIASQQAVPVNQPVSEAVAQLVADPRSLAGIAAGAERREERT